MIGKKLDNFKFWCQKVLPTVYDDSLSYYEYLNKLNEYLNEVITQINTLTTNMEDYEADLTAMWNQTKDYIDHYFDNLNVQTEINNKLDQMASDGTLSALLAPVVATQIGATVARQIGETVANQIDGVVAEQIDESVGEQLAQPVANATADWLSTHITPTSPVIDNTLSVSGAGADAQKTGLTQAPVYNSNNTYLTGEYVNYNGTIYRCVVNITTPEAFVASRWVAINSGNELNALNKMINNVQNDKIAYYKITGQYVSNTNGSIANYNGWSRTDYIPIDNLYSFSPKMSVASVYNCYYNSNKEFISSFYVGTTEEEKIIPSNASYMILSNTNEGLNSLEIKLTTEYEHNNLLAHQNINNVIDYLTDNGIPARDITSYVSNDNVYFLETDNVVYYSGDTFRQKTVVSDMTPYIESGVDYILYCGGIFTPNSSGCIRIYVEYTDSSYGYVDVNKATRFKHFIIDSNKIVSTMQLRIVATNGTSVASDGTAIFSNIYIFKGITLSPRAIFGNNNIFDDIPTYYYNQLETKEITIRGHKDDCAFNGDELIFLTDTHYLSSYLIDKDITKNTYNANHSIPLIKHIIKNTAIPMVVFGGDLIHTTQTKDPMLHSMNIFGSAFSDSKSRVEYCVGNHEYFTDNGQYTANSITDKMLYGGFIKYNEYKIIDKTEKDTYCFDNVVQKIRYFVIGCGGLTDTSVTQASWILDQFTKVPDNYKIICIGHAFLTDTMNDFRGYYKNIMLAMDAINSGASYSFNGNTYDYSALTNVEAICAITGHTHIDGYLYSTGGIPCICTTCDSYAQNYEIQEGVPVNVPRTINTVNEQAFDIVQFDFTGKKIYCTRIGYGSDRVFTYGT